MTISRWIILKMRNVSDKSCTENQNTYFVINYFFSRKSCRLWNNVKKKKYNGDRQTRMTIQRTRFACWITKTTHTHRPICNNYWFPTATMDSPTRLSVTLYVHRLLFISVCVYRKCRATIRCRNLKHVSMIVVTWTSCLTWLGQLYLLRQPWPS
jgi:hypothetical protein